MAQNTGDINNQFNYNDPTLTNPEGLGSLVQSEEQIRRDELANLAAVRNAYRKARPNVINAMQDADQMRSMDYTRGDIYIPDNDYGKRNVDKKITDFGNIIGLENARGEAQSAFAQVTNGIIKGTVLAGTTFADGVVGSIVGLLNIANDAANGGINGAGDALNSFIDNPFSRYMQKINDWSEKAFPNFYTDEERSKTWGTNVFSANFLGDHLIKNLGFMIGAAYSGRVNAGILSKAAGLNKVRDAYRGLNIVTKDGRKLSEASKIYEAYKKGNAYIDGVLIGDHLANIAKKTKRLEFGLQTFGAITSAMGEGRIEAIQNTEDWYTREKGMIEERTKQAENNVTNDVMAEQNDDGSYKYSRLVYNPETGSAQRQLTDEGFNEVQRRVGILQAEYEGALDQIGRSRATMANSIFLMNVGLLSASNLWTYGRFLSGGFKTGTKYTKMISEDSRKILSDAIRNGGKISEDIAKADMKQFWKNIGKAASVPIAEGPWEEMMQQSIATGMGKRESSRLNEYYGYQFDDEAETDAVSLMNSLLDGIAQTYTDPKQWEQGFVGAISSLAGIPSFHMRVNEAGKKRPSVSFNGELWDSIKDAREYREQAQNTADEVNKALKDERFVDLWRGYIRHKKYDNDKAQFLKELDQFEFNNAEIGQIVSDIELFDKAGMLDDLKTIIEQVGNITEQDADQIRKDTTIVDLQKGLYDGMTDQEVVDKVKSNAAEFKDFVDQYTKVRDDINTIYGGKVDDEVLRTMTWQTMVINDVEKRTKQLVDEVFPRLNELATTANEAMVDTPTHFYLNDLNDLNAVVYKKGSKEYSILNELLHSIRDFRTNEITLAKLNTEVNDAYNRWVSLGSKETKKSSAFRALLEANKNLSEGLANANITSGITDAQLDVLNAADLGQLIVKTQDLIRLVAYRNDFLNNLKLLSSHPELFTKEAVAANKEAIAKHSKEEAQRIYSELSNTDPSYRDAIANMSAETVKEFDKLIDDGDNEILKQQKESLSKYDDVVKRIFNVIKDDMFGEDENSSMIAKSLVGRIRELVNENSDSDDFLASMKNIADEAINKGDTVTADYINHLLNEYSTRKTRSKRADKTVGGKKPTTKSKREDQLDEAAKAEIPDDAGGFTPTFKKRSETQDSDDDGITIDMTPETPSESQESGNKPKPEESEHTAKAKEETQRANAIKFSDIITKASKKDVDSLKSLISQLSVGDVVSNEQADILREMAEHKILELTSQVDTGQDDGSAEQSKAAIVKEVTKNDTDPAALSGGIDSKDGNGQSSNKDFVKIDSGSLRGWVVTENDIRESVSGNKVAYTPDGERVPELLALQSALKKYYAYKFVDSGALGVLNHIYKQRGNDNGVPIRFVIDPLQSKKVDNKDFYTVMLAVEISPEDRSILGPYAKFMNTQTIDGKEYQIVGALKVGGNKGDAAYIEAKNAYNLLYGMVIQDVARQANNGPIERLYVADNVQSSISTFWNGRMETATNGKLAGFRSLKERLADYGLPYGFSIYFPGVSGGMVSFFTNKYMQRNGDKIMGPINGANQGSVWLNVIDPSGGIRQVYLRVKRVSEYDFENGTEFANNVKNQMKILVDTNASFVNKLRAKVKLSQMIYIPKGYVFSFNDKNGSVSLRFGKGTGDVITTVEDFINVMKSDDSLRFQVSENTISTPAKQKALIDADILETDYASLMPFNSSFSISFVGLDGQPTSQGMAVRGDLRASSRNNELEKIQYNNTLYYYNTTTGEAFSRDGEVITDGGTLAKLGFISNIKSGIIAGEDGTMSITESGVPQKFKLFSTKIGTDTMYAIKFDNTKETLLDESNPKDKNIINKAKAAINAFKSSNAIINGPGISPVIRPAETSQEQIAHPVVERPQEAKPKPGPKSGKRGKRTVSSGEVKPLFPTNQGAVLAEQPAALIAQISEMVNSHNMEPSWRNKFYGMVPIDVTQEIFKMLLDEDVDIGNPTAINEAINKVVGQQPDLKSAIERIEAFLDEKINCG